MTEEVERGQMAVNPAQSDLAAAMAMARVKRASIGAVVIRRDLDGNVIGVENLGIVSKMDNRTITEKIQDGVHALFRKIKPKGE